MRPGAHGASSNSTACSGRSSRRKPEDGSALASSRSPTRSRRKRWCSWARDRAPRILTGVRSSSIPALTLPAGASPKLRAPFERARAARGGAHLEANVVTDFQDRVTARTRIRIDGDAMALVAQVVLVTWRPGNATRTPFARTFPEAEVAWGCAEGRCAYGVVLTDAHGNALLEVGQQDAPLFAVRPEPTAVRPARPFFRTPWPYLGAASLCAVGGVVSTVRFTQDQATLVDINAHRSESYLRDAQAASRARARDATFLGVTFGAAAVLAGVSVPFW